MSRRYRNKRKKNLYYIPVENYNAYQENMGFSDYYDTQYWGPTLWNENQYCAPRANLKSFRPEDKNGENYRERFKPIKFKESYGIACCRFNLITREPEVLLIKKKYTYAFHSFVFLNYKNNNNELRKLFSQMTVQEKKDISKLNFDKLWCRIRFKIPDYEDASAVNQNDLKDYIRTKYHFEKNFMGDGERLKTLIDGTGSMDTIWEFPKGRPIKGERPIDTAIRELFEETGVRDKCFTLLYSNPIMESYIVNGYMYQHTLFVAIAKKFNWEPEMDPLSFEQSTEVEDVQWVDINKARELNLDQIEPQLIILRLFKEIVEKLKQYYEFSNVTGLRKISHL